VLLLTLFRCPDDTNQILADSRVPLADSYLLVADVLYRQSGYKAVRSRPRIQIGL
jgi:hypothetical protein